jgi:hypothetical protein
MESFAVATVSMLEEVAAMRKQRRAAASEQPQWTITCQLVRTLERLRKDRKESGSTGKKVTGPFIVGQRTRKGVMYL